VSAVLLESARITLKQHRFEVVAGALAAILLGAAAVWVNSRLAAVNVPPGCFDAWRNSGTSGPSCAGPINEFFTISEEAGHIFFGMTFVPLAAGLLAGVTLVGRELEARTAQTAWGLAASRRRWFGRQLWPILLVLGATVGFAAVAAGMLETTRTADITLIWRGHGLHGPLVVARAFATLGVGLVLGAAMGRTLPAFAVGAVLSVGLLLSSEAARGAWAAAQPRVVVDDAAIVGVDALIFEHAWRGPDGTLISQDRALTLAPQDEVEPGLWLIDQGYEPLQLGITAETARGWVPVEIAGFGAIGLGLVLATVLVVDRRRPR
jgi:hypothetical protein